jgi:hypothetical protein
MAVGVFIILKFIGNKSDRTRDCDIKIRRKRIGQDSEYTGDIKNNHEGTIKQNKYRRDYVRVYACFL